MSVQAISWVLDCSTSKMASRHVLISIANHADKHGKNAWPSIATIAQEAKLSERHVTRCLSVLVGKKELAIEIGAGPYGTNLYSLPQMKRDDILSGSKTVNPDILTLTPLTGDPKNDGADVTQTVLKENRPKNRSKTPPPSSENENSKKAKTSTKAQEFYGIIKAGFDKKHWELTWGDPEWSNLSRLLRARPNLTADEFRTMLRNRFKSQGINRAERPMSWLCKLPNYEAGPLNQYNRPLNQSSSESYVELSDPTATPEIIAKEQEEQRQWELAQQAKLKAVQ